MDWYKTKNILIFILIVLNITLSVVFYRTNTQLKIVESQKRDDIVSILSTNNIKLDKKLIPDAPYSFESRYVERAAWDNSSFVIKLLGNSYHYDEKNNTYSSGEKLLVVDKDSFTYTNKTPENPPEDMGDRYIKEYCIKEMKNLGIDFKLYTFDGLNYNKDSVRAIFTPVLDDYKFFDSYISFEVKKEGLGAIAGKNIIISKTASGISSKVFDISSVLLSLTSNPDINKSQIIKIAKISLGYYIGDIEDGFSNVLAIPVWQITTEGGAFFYYDARNGNYLGR